MLCRLRPNVRCIQVQPPALTRGQWSRDALGKRHDSQMSGSALAAHDDLSPRTRAGRKPEEPSEAIYSIPTLKPKVSDIETELPAARNTESRKPPKLATNPRNETAGNSVQFLNIRGLKQNFSSAKGLGHQGDHNQLPLAFERANLTDNSLDVNQGEADFAWIMLYPYRNPFRQEPSRRMPKNRSFEPFIPNWPVSFKDMHSLLLQPGNGDHKGATEGWNCEFENHLVSKSLVDGYLTERELLPAWLALRKEHRQEYWMSALLFTLYKWPRTAIPLLQNMLKSNMTNIPCYVSKDAIEHICSRLLLDNSRSVTKVAKASAEDIRSCFDLILLHLKLFNRKFGRTSLHQHTFWIISNHLDASQITQLRKALQTARCKLTRSLEFVFARRLFRLGDTDAALDILRSQLKTGLNDQNCMKLCVWMLRQPLQEQYQYKARRRLLDSFIKMGIRPNRQMYNVVLLNAMEVGDRQSAWSVYRSAIESGIPADAFTYSIMLRGVQHGDDLHSVKSIYEAAKTDGILYRSPVLGYHLVFATYLLQKSQKLPDVFQPTLEAYAELFDIAPLQKIGIATRHVQAEKADGYMRAPKELLGSMITAWLEENYHSPIVEDVYKKFLERVKLGDPHFTGLASATYVFNAFITSFGMNKTLYKSCTAIIRAMQDFSELPHLSVAPPDVMTWNCLAFAFIRNGRDDVAEQFLEVMKQQGIQPTDITWHQLLSGYATRQNLDALIRTVHRREQAGWPPNERTVKSLSFVKDRKKLFEILEEAAKSDAKDSKAEVVESHG